VWQVVGWLIRTYYFITASKKEIWSWKLAQNVKLRIEPTKKKYVEWKSFSNLDYTPGRAVQGPKWPPEWIALLCFTIGGWENAKMVAGCGRQWCSVCDAAVVVIGGVGVGGAIGSGVRFVMLLAWLSALSREVWLWAVCDAVGVTIGDLG
jgi:hypothetical protein